MALNRKERRARAATKGKSGRSAASNKTTSNVNLDLLLKLAGKAADAMPGDDEDDDEDPNADPSDDDDEDPEGKDVSDLLDAIGSGDDEDDEDPSDDSEDEDGSEGGAQVTLDADQLDALLDAALGTGEDEDEDGAMDGDPMPVGGMSAQAARKAKAKKIAQRKQAAGKSVAQELMKELEAVKLPTSVKKVIVQLAVEKRQRELDAKAARVIEQAKRARLQERKRLETERDYLDARLEEILMQKRVGRGMSFGGQNTVERGSKGYGQGIDRSRYASVNHNTKFRRGVEFKLADVIRAATDPEFRAGYMKEFKALGGATGSAGGYIVPEEWSNDFVKLLRFKAVVRQMATIVPMANDTFHLPKQTGASNAQWVGENADTSSGATDQTFGEIVFNAKKLVAFSKTSNELLADSSYGAEKIIRDDLLDDVVLAEDLAFLLGATGGNNPVGIYSLISNAQKLIGSGTANALTGDDIYRVMNRVEAKSARVDLWYTSADGLQVIRTLKDNNGNYLFSQENGVNGVQQVMEAPYGEDPDDYNVPVGMINNRPVYLSNQIPSTVTISGGIPTTLTGGTNTLLFGGMKRSLLIGQRKTIEIAASNVAGTAFANDQTWFRAVMREDFKLRVDDTFAVVAFPKGS